MKKNFTYIGHRAPALLYTRGSHSMGFCEKSPLKLRQKRGSRKSSGIRLRILTGNGYLRKYAKPNHQHTFPLSIKPNVSPGTRCNFSEAINTVGRWDEA